MSGIATKPRRGWKLAAMDTGFTLDRTGPFVLSVWGECREWETETGRAAFR